jgi:hypothetical protein
MITEWERCEKMVDSENEGKEYLRATFAFTCQDENQPTLTGTYLLYFHFTVVCSIPIITEPSSVRHIFVRISTNS